MLELEKSFIEGDLAPLTWQNIQPYFENLENREIQTVEDLKCWLKDKSELEGILQEDLGWRYIRQTTETNNEKFREDLEFFINEIEPQLSEYKDILNRKLLSSEYLKELKGSAYFVYLRGINSEVKLFRKENVPLFTELQLLSN